MLKELIKKHPFSTILTVLKGFMYIYFSVCINVYVHESYGLPKKYIKPRP